MSEVKNFEVSEGGEVYLVEECNTSLLQLAENSEPVSEFTFVSEVFRYLHRVTN